MFQSTWQNNCHINDCPVRISQKTPIVLARHGDCFSGTAHRRHADATRWFLVLGKKITMNYYRLLPLAGVLILAVVLTRSRAEKNSSQKPEAKSIAVTLTSLGYEPNKLEIHVGDS